jgi:glucosamine-6-phosphate deaminase
MEIIIVPTPEAVATSAAERIAIAVRDNPRLVLGVATGSSPELLYRELAVLVSNGRLSFAEAQAFALDEYVGIAEDHPASYAAVVRRLIAEPLGFSLGKVRVPAGTAADLAAGALAYDQAIRDAGGIDVQILGIGSNGHIGFNEPTSSLASRTRVATLTTRTRADNARFFDTLDAVPRRCITQGIGTILEAGELLLVAQGRGKAAAIAAAIEGPLSAFVPASALQLHQRATVIIDEAAATDLEFADYYRDVQQEKLLQNA